MSDAQLWESNVLRNLRRVSEARGMKFYVNPPREVVPDFLGSYQPDAIAVGPNGGTVIELKHREHLRRNGNSRQSRNGSRIIESGSSASSISVHPHRKGHRSRNRPPKKFGKRFSKSKLW